ncbi:MAG: lysophospholipase [Desulfofustis sp.]|nr:lysophospholipase [Desulfofustis sp.]
MNELTPSKMDKPEILAAIFHPRREVRNATPSSCEEFEVTVSENTTLGCRFFNPHANAPVILYFHGNGETVSDYDQIAPYYLKLGLNFFVAGYRGYGWSSGEPSVGALFHDAAVIFERVLEHCHNKGISEEFFIMGRSLGSAACIDLGHRFPDLIKGIIIDSGFSYTLPLAARLGYNVSDSGLSEEDCFNNLEKIREIKIPTLILHGAEDQLIPLNEAVKLQAESGARTKQLYVVPGADHNSLIIRGGAIYFETIKGFTDTVTVNRKAWRRRRKK